MATAHPSGALAILAMTVKEKAKVFVSQPGALAMTGSKDGYLRTKHVVKVFFTKRESKQHRERKFEASTKQLQL